MPSLAILLTSSLLEIIDVLRASSGLIWLPLYSFRQIRRAKFARRILSVTP